MNPLFDLLPLPIRDRLNYGTVTMDDEGVSKIYRAYTLAAPMLGEAKTVRIILDFIETKESELLTAEASKASPVS